MHAFKVINKNCCRKTMRPVFVPPLLVTVEAKKSIEAIVTAIDISSALRTVAKDVNLIDEDTEHSSKS